MPPVDDITSGWMWHVQLPAHTTHIAFSCSCLLYTDASGPHQFDWALGLNTLTSRNAFSNLPPQKPYTAMSKQAPSSVIADRCNIASPQSDCSCCETQWGERHHSFIVQGKPTSSVGNAVSQVNAPFSWESSMERWRWDGSWFWRFLASSLCFVRLL